MGRDQAKQSLRRDLLQKRSQLTEEYRKQASDRIVQRLVDYIEQEKLSRLFAYMPFRSEVDILPLIEYCWRNEIEIYIPKTNKENRSMVFYKILSWEDLEKGNYDILEPRRSCPEFQLDSVDAIILPGVAFTRDKIRLGYGGGYYDRYLEQISIRPKLIATAYSTQIVPELPIEPWDHPVDVIVTEEEWID